jgi:hypothetical protein
VRNRPLDIESAAYAIFGGAQREFDNWKRPVLARQAPASVPAREASAAHRGRVPRIAAVCACLDFRYVGQQIGECPYRRRFACAAVSDDQDAAYVRFDDAQDQRELHLVLSYDRGERIKAGALVGWVHRIEKIT